MRSKRIGIFDFVWVGGAFSRRVLLASVPITRRSSPLDLQAHSLRTNSVNSEFHPEPYSQAFPIRYSGTCFFRWAENALWARSPLAVAEAQLRNQRAD